MARVHYPKPPVVEALIDIQVEFDEGIPSIESLGQLGAQVTSAYPTREELRSFGIEVNVESGTEVKTTRELVGYRFWNADKDRVVQLRTNGILFSRIPSAQHPYDEWEVSSAETQKLWPLYRDALRPSRIRRLGVRYINRIRLPEGANTLDEFFTARPTLPNAIPLAIQSFVMRLVVPLPGVDGGVLVVGQGIVNDQNTPRGQTDVLLDLDVSRNVDMPCANNNSDVWSALEDLHARENDLFESFITPEAQKLFK